LYFFIKGAEDIVSAPFIFVHTSPNAEVKRSQPIDLFKIFLKMSKLPRFSFRGFSLAPYTKHIEK
jgi:hypothetical protein